MLASFEAIAIWPEPSPDERAAILVALTQTLRQRSEANTSALSPWAAAGRREALRARWSVCGGWGQERPDAW
jgi:hypothetical protein